MMMRNFFNPLTLIYFDIETVVISQKVTDLSPELFGAWFHKIEKELGEAPTAEVMQQKWEKEGAFHPEFSRICCATFMAQQGDSIKTKVFSDPDEIKLLVDMQQFLDHATLSHYRLCGHNILGFDIPFMIKRYLYQGLDLPNKLMIIGKKPWEINVVDTYDIWKMGSFSGKSATLDLLCICFGVESPKVEMSGNAVNTFYYEVENGLEKIIEYNKKDVTSLIKVIEKITKTELLK